MADQKITEDPVEACTHLNTIVGTDEKIECCSPVKRLLFPAMVSLKGGGWAHDGYSRKSPKS
jgi:predicted nucleic acid-binding Zn ribbon protein